MNKKGMLLEFLIVIYTFLLLSTILYQFTIKTPEISTKEIGTTSIEILNQEQVIKRQLFHIEQTLKYSSHEALEELSKNGGFTKEECKDWTKCRLTQERIELNYKETLTKIFQEKLQKINFPNNYDIIVTYKNNIEISIKAKDIEVGNKDIQFIIPEHEFSYVLDYDLNNFLDLYEKYHEARKECPSDSICSLTEDNRYFDMAFKQDTLFSEFQIDFLLPKIQEFYS